MIVAVHACICLTASVVFITILASSRTPNILGAAVAVVPLQVVAHIVAQIALT
ncbi:MAG: hypothetical protein KKB02_07310 [Alphaproteobacteria bacterium]|nr:hypothetical protein [Alphaproteobacteria bacterium]